MIDWQDLELLRKEANNPIADLLVQSLIKMQHTLIKFAAKEGYSSWGPANETLSQARKFLAPTVEAINERIREEQKLKRGSHKNDNLR